MGPPRDLMVWTGPRRGWFWLPFVLWTAAWVSVGVAGLLDVQTRAEAGQPLTRRLGDPSVATASPALYDAALVLGVAAVLVFLAIALLRRVARDRLAKTVAA